MLNVQVGDKIKVITMIGEPNYKNKIGVIESIDDDGQLHCSFGGCAIIPELDAFEIIKKKKG